MVEAVGGAVLVGEALVAFERLDVGEVFDLAPSVERAAMGGEHGPGVEDAHGVESCADDEGASHVVVRNRIIVRIESDVGRFACLDLDPLLAGEGVVGERDEAGAFFCEDVGDGAPSVLGTGTLGGTGGAPLIGLVVEVVEVAESARGEEARSDKADEPFHAAFTTGRLDRRGNAGSVCRSRSRARVLPARRSGGAIPTARAAWALDADEGRVRPVSSKFCPICQDKYVILFVLSRCCSTEIRSMKTVINEVFQQTTERICLTDM